MDGTVADRRAGHRRPAGDVEVSVTLRPGRVLQIVDISQGGAQVETDRPLRPGTRVHVRVSISDRTISLAALVLRCHVSILHAGGVTYRGALAFEECCPFEAAG